MRAQRRGHIFKHKGGKRIPNTGKHTLCQRARCTCTLTCHKASARGNLQEKFWAGSPHEACVEFYKKNAGPRSRGLRFLSLRSGNSHRHFASNFVPSVAVKKQDMCQTPIPRSTFRARLRNRNPQGHFTKAIYMC